MISSKKTIRTKSIPTSAQCLSAAAKLKKYIKTAAANLKALKIIINENFLAHSTEANSVRATISKICAKNHQNLMRGFEDISSKGPF